MKIIWYNFKQFIQNINNLIYWFPVIWKDRQWDNYYFLEIMRKKLIIMEKFYRSPKAHSMDSKKDADNILTAIKTLDRMISESYLTESLQEFDEMYPDYDWEMKFIPIEGTDLEEWTDSMTPVQTLLYRKCSDRAHKNEEEDYDFLFKHLRDHVQDWWD